ncbi:hypothetical protein ACL02T_16740 [Pseudonocardia sp. RS010]|uniref:hypothetical protein n=1 Tax=Pseudonocardia sp. RS010 TaxID=3385979 RepID=UPI0039A212DD
MTATEPRVVEAPRIRRRAGPQWGRIVLGSLIVAVGVGSMLGAQGVSVPWRFVPAVGLVLVGVVLLLSLAGGRGRADVVVIGVVLAVLAAGVGVGAARFAGPVGDRTIAAGPGGWPADTRLAAGTVEIDLTASALPTGGRMAVHVGAGKVVVRVLASAAVGVEADVVAGSVTVDGGKVEEGVDLSWSRSVTSPAPVVAVDLGVGDVEVHRVGS